MLPEAITLGLPQEDVTTLMRDIGRVALLTNLPRVVSGPVPNAAAMIYGSERLIVYSPAFMRQMQSAGSTWAVRFVFAHELGHHAEGHTVAGGGSTHAREYEADGFAARVLYRMGATLDQATAAMRAMPTDASPTHPSTAERARRIKSVYEEERAEGRGRPPTGSGSSAPGPAPVPPPTQSTPLQPLGAPRGTGVLQCGCWGPAQWGMSVRHQACSTGLAAAVPCQGMCMLGGQPWALVCQ